MRSNQRSASVQLGQSLHVKIDQRSDIDLQVIVMDIVNDNAMSASWDITMRPLDSIFYTYGRLLALALERRRV